MHQGYSLRISCIALSLWLGVALVAGSAAAEPVPPRLFEIRGDTTAPHKADRNPVGTVEETAIALDAGLVDQVPDSLELPLADGRILHATRTFFEATESYLSWAGQVEGPSGERGFLHLVDHGDLVSAILQLGSEQFQVVGDEAGHRWVRIEKEGPVCGLDSPATRRERVSPALDPNGLVLPLAGPAIDRAERRADEAEAGAGRARDEKAIVQIDVLAVYPSALQGSAETVAKNYMDAAIADANLIFANSNVNARYNLEAKERLLAADQPPPTDITGGFRWLTPIASVSQNPDDLGPAEVLALREKYAADMVVLFIPREWDRDNLCGKANLPGPNAFEPPPGRFGTRAFAAVRERCGRNDFTLAHELGHTFGMRHDGEGTGSEFLQPFGRGHVQFRTPWKSIANGSLVLDVAGDFTVGYHFTPQGDGWVTGLGGLYQGTKTISLWQDGVSSPLATLPVSSSNAWNYARLGSPLRVRSGQRYTVAVYTAGDGSAYLDPVPFPRSSAGITIHGTTVAAGNSRPTDTNPTIMYGNVDIQYWPAADLQNETLGASVLACFRTDGSEVENGVCNRIPYFSDPNLVVGGLPTGTPTSNNAAVARSEATRYALFRTNRAPVCQTDFLSTSAGVGLPVGFGDLTGNDSDPDTGSLYVHQYDRTTARGGSNDSGHAGGFTYSPPADFTGRDWFFYTVGDRPLGHASAQTTRCLAYVDVAGAQELIGQVGSVTTLRHVPRTLFYGRTYTKPIVIAQTPSFIGADTSVVRITSVQDDRFTFYVDEAPDRDGGHTQETVAYMVVEAGEWQMGDGSILRANSLQTARTVGRSVAGKWQTVSYGGDFGTTPVFFSQVQSNADPSWVKTRHRNIGSTSAQLALEKAEADAVSHGTETVGWLALEPGSGTWSGRAWTAGNTGTVVTHVPFTQNYGPVSTPRLFAAMSSYVGADGASVRYTSLGASSFVISIEEDTTLDPELIHAPEAVDYLVIGGSGDLYGTRP